MKIERVTFWTLIVVTFLAAPRSVLAGDQERHGPDRFKAMSPRELVQSLDRASRLEGPEIVDALIENWDSSMPLIHERVLTGTFEQKRLALKLLADLREKRSVETLVKAATEGSDVLIRTRVIIVLRDIGDRSVAPLLRDLLRTSDNGFVLSATLAALGKLGSSKDIPVIRPWLGSSEEGVRVQAAAALALLGSAEGQDILIASVGSKDPLMQQWATEALGHLNTVEARQGLEEILNDPEGQWKSYARIALAQQELNTRGALEQTEYLTLLAKDRNRRVALWSVEQLGRLDTPEATHVLRDVARMGGKVGQKAGRLLTVMEGRAKK